MLLPTLFSALISSGERLTVNRIQPCFQNSFFLHCVWCSWHTHTWNFQSNVHSSFFLELDIHMRHVCMARQIWFSRMWSQCLTLGVQICSKINIQLTLAGAENVLTRVWLMEVIVNDVCNQPITQCWHYWWVSKGVFEMISACDHAGNHSHSPHQ